MKKAVIGYIYCNRRFTRDEKFFLKSAKKHGAELVMFNLLDDIDEATIESKAKSCDVIYCNSAEEFALEFVKTLEALGKKVIDPSSSTYYKEDKWLFFLNCKKHKISTAETILLSENISLAKKDLKKFNHWPVVLKRVEGTCGEYVSLAKTSSEAENIIKRFWKKGSEKLPIIAQEFIPSPCYRVTAIDGKISQTAVKQNRGWKSTGVYAKKIGHFKTDPELEKIVKKLCQSTGIKVCGVDLLKKDGKWIVLEVNSDPAFDFFESQRERLIDEVMALLVREAKKR